MSSRVISQHGIASLIPLVTLCNVDLLIDRHPVLLFPCEFRHVMLPKDIAKRVPKTHLMSETEWRNLGVQQSQGWVHYMIHQPGS